MAVSLPARKLSNLAKGNDSELLCCSLSQEAAAFWSSSLPMLGRKLGQGLPVALRDSDARQGAVPHPEIRQKEWEEEQRKYALERAKGRRRDRIKQSREQPNASRRSLKI